MAALNSDAFTYKNGKLFCEDIPVTSLGDKLGLCSDVDPDRKLTPVYVYSKAQLQRNIQEYKSSFSSISHIIGYSLKANYNPELLKIILNEGLSVVTVSGFEVKLALEVGFSSERIYFYGNGKQIWEICLAIQAGCFINVDSRFDAENIVKCAEKLKKQTQVLLRINPNMSVEVHRFLNTGSGNSKFGVTEEQIDEVLRILQTSDRVSIVGLQVHLGSTVREVQVYAAVHDLLRKHVARNFQSFTDVKILSVGGGLGIDYSHSASDYPRIQDLAKALSLESGYKIMVEPGRSIVGNCGILITSVIGYKTNGNKKYLVVDAAMNDLIRPSLYSASHLVIPTQEEEPNITVDVVGPVCECSDFLAKDCRLPLLNPGDLIAVLDCGAYCAAMASNYNMRGRSLEILVHKESAKVIGKRETFDDVTARFSNIA